MDRTSIREPSSGRQRQVVFLLLPHVHLLDLSGAAQVFYEANGLGPSDYRLVYAATSSRVESAQGLALGDLEPLPEIGAGDIVVVPGTESQRLGELAPAVPADWLRGAHAAGATVCSVCTGAFALGVAGLLAHRECTTHWRILPRLRRDFPTARVLDDRLFVKADGVYTSAGVASGIDLALSMIEDLDGPLVAARVARELVVYLRRTGSQEQRSIFLEHRSHLHPGVHRAQEWLLTHPAENPTLDELAALAEMSPRNLTRRFRQLTGISLKEYAHRLKLEVARNLLCDPRLTVDGVAGRCGFADARQLRRLWQRHFDTSPAAWRERQLASGRLERSPHEDH